MTGPEKVLPERRTQVFARFFLKGERAVRFQRFIVLCIAAIRGDWCRELSSSRMARRRCWVGLEASRSPADLFEQRTGQYIEPGYRIEDERPIPVKRSLLAHRSETVTDRRTIVG